MIYLLYGLEKYLIDKELQKIITKTNIPNININQYDLTETLIEEIIEDALMMSLFSEDKIIIIKNSDVFTGAKINLNHNLEKLEAYINNPNPNTIVIFISNTAKLDERKKIVKQIKEKGIVKSFNKPKNLNNIVKDMFGDYEISFQDITLLIDRVGKNLEIIEQEINKIKIFKDENKQITTDDIIKLTSKNIEADVFELIDSIITKDKEKAIDIYNELLKINEEPIKIIVMLANQIRLMYQAKELYKKGYTGKDIATNLKIHPYRISLALEKSREYESSKLINYLNKLADLDINIKSGTIDKNLGLELFILTL